MTLKAAELVAELTSLDAVLAVTDIFGDAGRPILPRGALKKPTFTKHGDPGFDSNRNTIGNALMAYWLFDDKQALLQAALVAERLIETWDKLDRAHSHRYAWLGPLALALKEIGDPRWKKVLDYFNKIVSWFHGQKYLNGSFVGATLRPLRCLFEAGLTARFAMDMAAGGIGADGIGGEQLLTKANLSIDQFIHRVVGGDIHWGWTKEPGVIRPSWKKFPYVDSLEPKAMAKHTTAFHALHVMPYSFLVGRLAEVAVTGKDYMARWHEIASHALRLCYDPVSGRNTKSIGYKADHSAEKREAYYAPGFATKPARKQSPAWKAEYMEQGYPDVSPAIEAVLDAGEIDKAEARRVIVKWVKRSRGIVGGEIPVGLVSLALKVSS